MFCFKRPRSACLFGWRRKAIRRVSGWRFLLLWLWRRLYSKFFADGSKSCKGISLLFSDAI